MKLIFLATEDWFVRSHFLPLLREARRQGFDVIVAARDSGALTNQPGVRVIDMPFARRALAPGDVWREARAVRALLATERPAVVHAIALKPIALHLLADGARTPSVLALTGRGYLAARGAAWTKMILAALARRMRAALMQGCALLLTENEADRAWIAGGAELPAARTLLMPGAGVDPKAFTPSPEPGGAIVVGISARLVRSKGIDLAVAAIQRLRERGLDVELRIAGAADPDNPEQVSVSELDAWRALAGVSVLGRVDDINAFWAGAHIACLPSRGGEGLPRTLLEAAACGRPIVTIDVPGCADFVLSGETGLVVPREHAVALADAIGDFAASAQARHDMGAAGRARVLAGYTEAHAAAVAAEAWRRCLDLRS